MLLEFSVENYRSLYGRTTLDLQANKAIKEYSETNVFEANKYYLLHAVAIYGANSSGKSNLIGAIHTMARCVLTSVKLNDNDELEYDPFLLLENNQKPTTFEAVFIIGEFCYRYGFCYNRERITREWLFRTKGPRSKENPLFRRIEKGIDVDKKLFKEGLGLEAKTNGNRLFLSVCQQLGGNISRRVISWFQSQLKIVDGQSQQHYREYSKQLFYEQDESYGAALKFFQKMRLGFNSITTHYVENYIPNDLPSELKALLGSNTRNLELESVHNIYDENGEVAGTTRFKFLERESAGSNKLFDLSGPIFVTLYNGGVLVIDELDAKLHPIVSQQIIALFNNPETNPKNAQLIFTTHNTHLLSKKILRRDQVWFTEKNEMEQTDLYCLNDIVLPDGTKPRNDANFEKNYINGRYGAIPYIMNE